MNAIVKSGSNFSLHEWIDSRPIIYYILRKRETQAPGAETQEAESIWVRAELVKKRKMTSESAESISRSGRGEGAARFSIDARSFIPLPRAFVRARMNERPATILPSILP